MLLIIFNYIEWQQYASLILWIYGIKNNGENQ